MADVTATAVALIDDLGVFSDEVMIVGMVLSLPDGPSTICVVGEIRTRLGEG